MEFSYYEEFKHALASGRRATASTALQPFIESFGSLEEKARWTRWYLENESYGHRIRHEIYESIIFPVLRNGYENSDPWCILWLARTAQNFYSSQSLWAQIDGKTGQSLLRELVELCPTHDEARANLLSNLIESFRYMVHEWPTGILYGCDGATADECLAIVADLDLARRLDSAHLHDDFLEDVSSKVREYQERLDGIDV